MIELAYAERNDGAKRLRTGFVGFSCIALAKKFLWMKRRAKMCESYTSRQKFEASHFTH